MNIRFSFILVLLICINCNSNFGLLPGGEVLTNVEELVLKIGTIEEFSGNEAMLTSPFAVAVTGQNDIMIVDSNIVRVYDQSGVRMEPFGGITQRPGGIINVRRIWINPSGYITVFGGNFGSIAQYYRPDLSFMEMKSYFSNPPYQAILKSELRTAIRLENALIIDEAKRLFTVHTRSNNTFSSGGRDVFILYESEKKFSAIARYPQTRRVPEVGEQGYDFLGVLLLDVLPGNRIAYMHSFHDSNTDETGSSYSIKIQSLENLETKLVTRNYSPVEINWIPEEFSEEYKLKYPFDYVRSKSQQDAIKKYLDEKKYKTSLQKILTDNEYIFAFTYTVNKNNATLVDVFNADSGEYVQSAYFRYVPEVIKNGYYYRINDLRFEGKRSVVEKYKIDPAVYGK